MRVDMAAMLNGAEVGGLTFSATFDSGNAKRVEQLDDHEFALWTAGDCEDTQYENKNRTWWHFSVRGVTRGRMLTFHIHNMNAQGRLFRADMRPVWRALPSKPAWSRIPIAATHTGTKEEDNFVLRFRHKCDVEPDETLFFAFSFPLTYGDLTARLAWLDALFGLPAAAVSPCTAAGKHSARATGNDGEVQSGAVASAAAGSGVAVLAARPGGNGALAGVYQAALAAAAGTAETGAALETAEMCVASVQAAGLLAPARKPSSIYYHRELLTRSLEGRRIDLITISGTNGMLAQNEAGLRQAGCMPEGGPRPRAFANKPVFLLTARVHPGEIPASHVLDGFLEFILNESDPRARALRDRFVFKLVPMINPDGVYRGQYRTDTMGHNLNRCYLACKPETHPAVHAIACLVRQLHARGELMFYIDTHGHATKVCYCLGKMCIHAPMMHTVVREIDACDTSRCLVDGARSVGVFSTATPCPRQSRWWTMCCTPSWSRPTAVGLISMGASSLSETCMGAIGATGCQRRAPVGWQSTR